MNFFYMDASALVKRYHLEPGSDVVNRLLNTLLSKDPERIVVSQLVLAETISVLNRVRNTDLISMTVFQKASTRVLFEARQMGVQELNDHVVLQAVSLISRHNINSSDAIHLRQALNVQQLLQPLNHDLYLVAADRRLLRAAQNEGMSVVDPGAFPLADVDLLLGLDEEASNVS